MGLSEKLDKVTDTIEPVLLCYLSSEGLIKIESGKLFKLTKMCAKLEGFDLQNPVGLRKANNLLINSVKYN